MNTTRRAFIKRSFTWLLALLGIGGAAAGTRTLIPPEPRKTGLVFFPLVPETDVPRRGVLKTELSYTASGRSRRTRVFVVAGDGGMVVLSAVCTHLGCLVNYRRDKKEFLCPCHGGRYDIDGRNIAGPPPRPLTRFPVKAENGMVLVGVRV